MVFGLSKLLIGFSTILLAAIFGLLPTHLHADSRDKVIKVLDDMGYIDVSLDGCWLQFSRRVEPSTSNGGFFAYTRYFDLNTFSDFSSNSVTSQEGGGRIYFRLDSKFDEEYDEKYSVYFKFRSWSRRNYPDSSWPYTHPKRHDEFTPILEFEANRLIDLEELNRTVQYGAHGPSTVLASAFDLSYGTDEELKEFQSAIEAFSQTNSCEIN